MEPSRSLSSSQWIFRSLSSHERWKNARAYWIKWLVDADVESLAWNPHTEHSFVVSLENGTVTGFDIRAPKTDTSSRPKPSFTLHAHDKAVSSISYNPLIPNLLATGSTDTLVKLWDLSNDRPSCVASKNPNAGAAFSIAFSEDSPLLLAIGGSKGKLKVWDAITDAGISREVHQQEKGTGLVYFGCGK